MRVNGFDLDPGKYQITMECVSRPGETVIRNCPNYEDAMVTLEILTNDPRSDLERGLKKPIRFHVLDWEGKTCCYAHFDHCNLLRGEQLAIREIEWEFGHSKLAFPDSSAFWLACYLGSLAFVIALPLLLLTAVWDWIAPLLHR